jgi:hypothetical protein
MSPNVLKGKETHLVRTMFAFKNEITIKKQQKLKINLFVFEIILTLSP